MNNFGSQDGMQRFTPPPADTRVDDLRFVYLYRDGRWWHINGLRWRRAIMNYHGNAVDVTAATQEFWTEVDPNNTLYIGAILSGAPDESARFTFGDQYDRHYQTPSGTPTDQFTVFGEVDRGEGPMQVIYTFAAFSGDHAESLYRAELAAAGKTQVAAVFSGEVRSIDFDPEADHCTMTGMAPSSPEELEMRDAQYRAGAAAPPSTNPFARDWRLTAATVAVILIVIIAFLVLI